MNILCKAMELQTTFIFILGCVYFKSINVLIFSGLSMFLPFLVPVVNNTGGELDICLLKRLVAFFSPAFAGMR